MLRAFRCTAWLICVISVGCGRANDHDQEAFLALRDQLRADSEVFAGLSIEQMAQDARAVQFGSKLFDTDCAACHGADAMGKHGVTDLIAGTFSYGRSPEAIRTTIASGRRSVMPAFGNQLGEMQLGQLAAYTHSLSSDEPLSDFAKQGRALFASNCAHCHGTRGAGVPELGAPDLTDDHWLYGDSVMAIRLIMTRGAQGECPAHSEALNATQLDLLTSFVLQLSEAPRSEHGRELQNLPDLSSASSESADAD